MDVTPPFDPNALYQSIVEEFVADPDVLQPTASGKRFGASGQLTVGGKIFAMLTSKGQFVVKLSRKPVDELVAAGRGERPLGITPAVGPRKRSPDRRRSRRRHRGDSSEHREPDRGQSRERHPRVGCARPDADPRLKRISTTLCCYRSPPRGNASSALHRSAVSSSRPGGAKILPRFGRALRPRSARPIASHRRSRPDSSAAVGVAANP